MNITRDTFVAAKNGRVEHRIIYIFPPCCASISTERALGTKGAIHSTKISGNFGPKLNGSVRSNRKSFEKTGPPFEVVLFSRSDRSEFWLNGSRPKLITGRPALRVC